jgi:hypothetical protein
MSNHHDHGGDHHHHADTMGVHGMLVFGDDRIYLSHLPMFSMPEHCFQVLLQVSLDPTAQATYRASLHTANGAFHTFEPKPFPITELDPQSGSERNSMAGTLVQGHFERGGTPIVKNTTVQVSRVQYFRALDPQAEHDRQRPLTYLCFGSPTQLWLAHEITARPDFDQVLPVQLTVTTADSPGTPRALDVGDGRVSLLQIDGRRDHPEERLRDHERAVGTLILMPGTRGHREVKVNLETGAALYFEADELR